MRKPERWNDPKAHVKLKQLFEEFCPPGMTQADFGAEFDIGTQGMVWQYLNGHTPLSLEAAAKFARGLRCTIYDISPPLAEAMKANILPVLGPRGWLMKAARPAVVAALCILPPYPAEASKPMNLVDKSWSVYYVNSRRSIRRIFFRVCELTHTFKTTLGGAVILRLARWLQIPASLSPRY